MINPEPTEYRWRRPDGTVLLIAAVPSHGGFALDRETQRQMMSEPQIIVEWRIIGEKSWTVYGTVEHGQGGATWWNRVGA